MTAVLVAAEMRLFPASLSVSGLPAAAAAAAAAARALGAPLKIVAAAGAGRLVVGPAIAWLALAIGDVASNKELAAAWPAVAVAAGGAALFLSNKAAPPRCIYGARAAAVGARAARGANHRRRLRGV